MQLHRKLADNQWAIFDYRQDGVMELSSIGCSVALVEVFAGLSG